MKYQELNSDGHIVMVTGGTGLYPFIDFIDLLFKKMKVNEGHSFSSRILELNPVLSEDIVQKRTFTMLFASECLRDVPKITLF